jgi:hypothetical protein
MRRSLAPRATVNHAQARSDVFLATYHLAISRGELLGFLLGTSARDASREGGESSPRQDRPRATLGRPRGGRDVVDPRAAVGPTSEPIPVS